MFHGLLILSDVFRTVGYISKMLWNYESVEPNVIKNPKIITGHCDLYFMVQ